MRGARVCLCSGGKREEAFKILEQLKPLLETNLLLRFRAALIYAALNEHDDAFALLDTLCEERFIMVIYLNAPVYFQNLRSDPRFQELLRRIGLPP